MSLKAFHLIFIVASILLAAGMAAYGYSNYAAPGGTRWDLATGIGATVIALGLVVYEKYFLKKLMNVSFL